LRTVIDDALREEGVARELVHAIQLARKNADLRIEDTVALTLRAPADLSALVERHRETIAAETLATELVVGDARGEHRETARIEGAEVEIGLSRSRPASS
jgi:isoleucyl-tRNA synthetase